MNKVIIELSDTDDDGGVSFHVEFDPPITNDDQILTPAQAEAAFMIEVMQRRASGQTLQQIAEEMDDEEYGHTAGGYEPSEVIYEDKEDDVH
jgi:hypothetical protein